MADKQWSLLVGLALAIGALAALPAARTGAEVCPPPTAPEQPALLPDLMVEFTGPAAVRRNATFSVTAKVTNIGAGPALACTPATPCATLAIWTLPLLASRAEAGGCRGSQVDLSAETTIDGYWWGRLCRVPVLAPGESLTLTVSFVALASSSREDYVPITATAASVRDVGDADRTNNSAVLWIKVSETGE